jgi:hypothetical protein
MIFQKINLNSNSICFRGYAELIERRIRREIGIEHVDMLFLHSPSSLNLTLNDLYERFV